MAGTRIVTDSASDLAPGVAEEHRIGVVPLTIRFGDDVYTDGVDLSTERFYELMAGTDDLPATAAPSPGQFIEAFTEAADNGADAVVCVLISEKLSATIESARAAARDLEGQLDVRVIDSASITSGLGTIVRRAAQAAAEGRGPDDIETLVADLSAGTHIFGGLDTLDNLRKGGRIGGAQAMVGSMLSIKPIIDISTGEVTEASRARTRRKAMLALRNQLRAETGTVTELCVPHGLAPDLETFLDLIGEDHERDRIRTTTIGPVIGTHGGPRILGLSWVAE